MNPQDSVTAPAAPAGLARHRAGLRGIAGRIAAIVAGLLVVFVVSGVGLLAMMHSLQRSDPRILALTTGRQTVLASLLDFGEQLRAFDQVLIAGTDSTARAKAVKDFQREDAEVDEELAQAIRELPEGEYRDKTRAFANAHVRMRVQYDKALAAFQASGGRNPAAAAAAVRGIETEALETYQQAAWDMRVERDRLNAVRVALVAKRMNIAWGVGTLLVVVLSIVAAVVIRRIVRPIRQLTQAAEQVASHDLPAAVARIRSLQEGEEPPALERIVVGSSDETSSLADAFHSLHSSALALAVEQRRAERESAEMLVNLGRRNQNLLNRTLAFITELERTEQDPDVLDRLFRLDHATTRIRRNAESMLVLAGASQTRTWSVPAPAADVVRASLSEIEDYNRVDIYHIQDAAITGSAIADVVHLLAELVENAANFSPPSTQVTVVG